MYTYLGKQQQVQLQVNIPVTVVVLVLVLLLVVKLLRSKFYISIECSILFRNWVVFLLWLLLHGVVNKTVLKY